MDGNFSQSFSRSKPSKKISPGIIQLVKEKKADVGIAYDGDADRIGVITDEGKICEGETSFCFSSLDPY